MIDAELLNRNATDILLGKMVKEGTIKRVGRGRYCLDVESNGQMGQKEKFGSQDADVVDKFINLFDLSHDPRGAPI